MITLTEKFRMKNGQLSKYDLETLHQINATHRLWHQRIRVFVPRYAAHDPGYVKLFGTHYTTGMPKDIRDKVNKEMTQVYMAPIRHIMLYGEGIPIAYPDRIKAVEVYKDIQSHLRTWQDILSTSMNARNNAPDMEDFDLMLEFAQNLEQFLAFYYREKSGLNIFKRATLNRYADVDKGIHRADSTYNQLREGIYSLVQNRVARQDDSSYKAFTEATATEAKSETLTSGDHNAALDSIRRIREG